MRHCKEEDWQSNLQSATSSGHNEKSLSAGFIKRVLLPVIESKLGTVLSVHVLYELSCPEQSISHEMHPSFKNIHTVDS